MRRKSARSTAGGSAAGRDGLGWLAATRRRYCRVAERVNGIGPFARWLQEVADELIEVHREIEQGRQVREHQHR